MEFKKIIKEESEKKGNTGIPLSDIRDIKMALNSGKGTYETV